MVPSGEGGRFYLILRTVFEQYSLDSVLCPYHVCVYGQYPCVLTVSVCMDSVRVYGQHPCAWTVSLCMDSIRVYDQYPCV